MDPRASDGASAAPEKKRKYVRRGPVPGNLFGYLLRVARSGHAIVAVMRIIMALFYKQTVLGPIWLVVAALLPVLGMAVIFQHIESLQQENLPYPLFLLSGMTLWAGLNIGISRGMRTVNFTRRLHMTLNVPRLVVIIGITALPLIFFSAFFVVLCAAILFYLFMNGLLYLNAGWGLLLAPVCLVLMLLLIWSVTCFTSIIFMLARDIRFMQGLFLQLWFLATPILYPLQLLPERWQEVSRLFNPMTGIVEAFRWSVFGVGHLDTVSFAAGGGVAIAAFLLGAWFMMRTDIVLRDIL